jgi:copper chaperone CopZ
MIQKTLATLASIAMISGAVSYRAAYAQQPAVPTTKATFSLTGLHCPPCASTVQNSLVRVKGVKSVIVDWNRQIAKIEFDENVLPAQSLAAAIENTPHMMGGGMRYAGWLAFKVPSMTDDPSGKKVKDVLTKVAGVKSVAVYPAQHATSVLFARQGTVSSQQIIDALAKEGIEAAIF